jgi:hypothetical protein
MGIDAPAQPADPFRWRNGTSQRSSRANSKYSIDFHGRAQRQDRNANGAARVAANVSEHGDHQFDAPLATFG